MKHVKILGLAAVAAMALMAFAGAGTASATTLFSGATKLGAGTELIASLTGSANLREAGGEKKTLDTCPEGEPSVLGKTKQETGPEITSEGEVTVTWGTHCTFKTETIKGGTLGISWIPGTKNGTVKSFNAEVTVLAFGLITCTYGTAATGTDLGTLVGSTTGNAVIEINAPVVFKSGSFTCPKETVWEAKYSITTPTPLHVTE